MQTVFRWLLRIFVGIVALCAAALTLAWYFAARSLPDYNETITIDGISAPVEIVRDTANVPHIFGQTDEDVFFGLGFAHAQDRLWQMTMLRRTVQGRLSEVFGQRTVGSDELMRRLDLYRLAASSFEAQDDATKAALQAYARGVNAWIETVNAEARGRGAPEFFLFSNEIAFWQPADSLAILKLIAFRNTAQARSDVLRARLSLLSPDWVRDLMPDIPGPGIASLPPYASLMPGVPRTYAADAAYEDPLAPMPGTWNAGASNAWAAAPSRSAAGGALLANDPHVDFAAPSLFYLARIELESGGVIGATIPGMPIVIAGRNARFGWGIGAAWADDQDILLEELDPADPGRYRTPEGWKRFETRKSILQIKDARPVTLELQWSDNGPILPGSLLGLAAVTPPDHVASLGWTALTAQDPSMSAAMRLMQAGSIDEAIAVGKDHVAPVVNVTMADQQRVALVMFGALPDRNPMMRGQGRLPALGWMPENRWRGTLPFASNPRFVDPTGGIVANTNNKLVDRPFPDHVSFTWGDSQRIQRLTRLLQEREVHTRESFIAAQLDTVSPAARTLLPLVAADLWFTGDPAPEGTPERMRQRALEMLAEWDGEMNEHLPEPLIYATWMRVLQDRLIRDELGPLASAFTHVEPLFIERVYRDIDGAAHWCDVVRSSRVETCTDIARAALDEALLQLRERFGRNLESWRWGDVHEAAHDHPVLGRIPVLGWFVNIRQSTSGGDFTLNMGRTAGIGDTPFLNVNGAGYRGVYDFADPDSSVFIISTGQSGHPLSPHYDDLSVLWRRGEYVPMSLDPELARAGATGITRLLPRRDISTGDQISQPDRAG